MMRVVDKRIDVDAANRLSHILRAAINAAGENDVTGMAALTLCVFNMNGYGNAARARGLDVQAELKWFLETFCQALATIVESRYGSH